MHAHGRLRVRDEKAYLRGVLARLTRENEQRSQQARPWKMGDALANDINERLKDIVGIEIQITRLVGKSKLSQNREARDRLEAAEGVAGFGNAETAQAMRGTGGM